MRTHRAASGDLCQEGYDELTDAEKTEWMKQLSGIAISSDAFFPFADGPQVLIDAGVSAIVQPGGSVRDEEVVKAARDAGVTMFFTRERHFFH